MRHALLSAWRLALSNTLLKELEELEACYPAGGPVQAAPAAAAMQDDGGSCHLVSLASQNLPAGNSFELWLQGHQAKWELPELTAEAKPANNRSSGRQQGSGSGRQLAGAKRALGSRPVCYTSAGPAAVASTEHGCSLIDMHLAQEESDSKRACGGAPMPPCQASYGQLMQDAQRAMQPWTLHLMPKWHEQTGWQGSADSCMKAQMQHQRARTLQPQSLPASPRLQPPAAPSLQQLPLDSEDEVSMLLNSWEREHWQEAQHQQDTWQHPGHMCSSSEELEAHVSRWAAQHNTGSTMLGLQQDQVQSRSPKLWEPMPTNVQSSVQDADRVQNERTGDSADHGAASSNDWSLLDGTMAAAAPRLPWRRRAQSAPPQPSRQRKHVVTAKSGGCAAGMLAERALFRQAEVQKAAHDNPSQPAASLQPQPYEQPGAGLFSFLQADTGLDTLLASWRHPGGRSYARSRMKAGGAAPADGVLSLTSLASAAFAQLKPSALMRSDLAAGRALQQVQCKFIPVMCGSLLALVDQHAAGGLHQMHLQCSAPCNPPSLVPCMPPSLQMSGYSWSCCVTTCWGRVGSPGRCTARFCGHHCLWA